MYEYLNFFDFNFWQSFTYAFVAMATGCYYLSLGISGLHLNRIQNTIHSNGLRTDIMAFCQTIVCLLVFVNFFLPMYSDKKVLVNLLIFLAISFARFYYWKNLSIIFNEKRLIRLAYNIIISCAAAVTLIHILLFFIDGGGQCCLDNNVVNNISNNLIRIQNPFRMSPLLTRFLQVYLISVTIIYIRFFIKALKSDDLALKVGLAVSISFILYSILFVSNDSTMWAPFYFLIDIIEYTRFQKLEVENINKAFERHKTKEQMLIHDIANPLQYTWTRLQKIDRRKKRGEIYELSEDMDSLYSATNSAIQILNNYKRDEQPKSPISKVIKEVIEIFPDFNIIYKAPSFERRVNSTIMKNTLINLIKNSHEALGDNLEFIRITVEVYGDQLHLQYIDNGKYKDFINPDAAFELGVSTKGTPGSGMGLASIREELESIKGRIELGEFQSNTCFDIFI